MKNNLKKIKFKIKKKNQNQNFFKKLKNLKWSCGNDRSCGNDYHDYHFRMALIQYYKKFDLQSFLFMVVLLLLLCENGFFPLLPWAAHMAKNWKSISEIWSEAPSVLSDLWFRSKYLETMPERTRRGLLTPYLLVKCWSCHTGAPVSW